MVIETFDLTKHYGQKVGCAEICLSVSEGQVFGFLGPNGAGKSTLVKMLVGLIHPTSGTARILDRPLGDLEARRRIGFLPENFRYQEWLTGRQLLGYHGRLYRMPRPDLGRRIERVLAQVGLTERADSRIKTYSRGMQQRVGLACALLPDPDLLFLDEPTSALDPIGRREVREIILALREQGKTVFLNSHLLGEVELLCDAVAVIKQGRILEMGETGRLRSGSVIEVGVEEMTPQVMAALGGAGFNWQREGQRWIVDGPEPVQPALVAEIIFGAGGRINHLVRRTNSLEAAFLKLLQEEDH